MLSILAVFEQSASPRSLSEICAESGLPQSTVPPARRARRVGRRAAGCPRPQPDRPAPLGTRPARGAAAARRGPPPTCRTSRASPRRPRIWPSATGPTCFTSTASTAPGACRRPPGSAAGCPCTPPPWGAPSWHSRRTGCRTPCSAAR
ncbi:hypothetical protein [Cryobacterium sp. M23]|uniref:hypothetical protein n=1 Tax=Cryobacterium sp. M23 TaxID=2048292 RepID=UPI001E483277|nr:hypothetical protein [Cryobacterium sp. M23]